MAWMVFPPIALDVDNSRSDVSVEGKDLVPSDSGLKDKSCAA